MGKASTRIRLLKQDIDRYVDHPEFQDVYFPKGNNGFCYFAKVIILFFVKRRYNFRCILYYRLGGRLSAPLKFFFKPAYEVTNIWCKDVAGGGIFFSHPWNTVLCCEHIGYGCSFLHNTTFGNKPKNGSFVKPYLGNNVHVGAHVVCIGDVHIGNNVTIGAGTVLMKSVPDNCVVVGNPARIIKKAGVKCNILL